MLARQGKLVLLFLSHDIEFLIRACDRVIHMNDGAVQADSP